MGLKKNESLKCRRQTMCDSENGNLFLEEWKTFSRENIFTSISSFSHGVFKRCLRR